MFNPLVGDGGFAEGYAAVKLSDGSYVTTGYGGATAEGVASTLGFKTTEAPDIVSFKVKGTALDTTYGTNGNAVVQSEGLGLDDAEDRGRSVVGLPGDRTLHVGRFGGVPAAVVLDASGKLDTTVSGDGILDAAERRARRAVLRRGAVARRQAHRALDQQRQGRRPRRDPRAAVG